MRSNERIGGKCNIAREGGALESNGTKGARRLEPTCASNG